MIHNKHTERFKLGIGAMLHAASLFLGIGLLIKSTTILGAMLQGVTTMQLESGTYTGTKLLLNGWIFGVSGVMCTWISTYAAGRICPLDDLRTMFHETQLSRILLFGVKSEIKLSKRNQRRIQKYFTGGIYATILPTLAAIAVYIQLTVGGAKVILVASVLITLIYTAGIITEEWTATT